MDFKDTMCECKLILSGSGQHRAPLSRENMIFYVS